MLAAFPVSGQPPWHSLDNSSSYVTGLQMCPSKFLQTTLTTLEKCIHSNVEMEQNSERLHKVANKDSFKCPVFSTPEAVTHPSDQNVRNAPSLRMCVK